MANLDFISNQALVDANGTPYAGAKVYYYETGTTTPKAVYSNAGLTSAHSQPVVADSNGVVPPVYLLAGRYKRAVTTSADVTLSQYACDPLDASSQLIAQASAPSATYAFLRYHNTTDGNVYRRNAANSAWINEGPVDSLVNAATVSEVLTGTDSTKAVTPDALAAIWQRGTDIASATTLSLPASGGRVFNITGTTTINGISSAQGGRMVMLRFAGALTLTHNATSFILNGGANITTAAGDTAIFVNEAASDAAGSNWRMFGGMGRASGSPINITDLIATQADQETATSTTLAVTPGRFQFHPAAAKGWGYFDASSGTPSSLTSRNVSSITDGGVGIFTANWTTSFSAATYQFSGFARATIVNSSNVVSQNTTQSKAAGSQPFTVRTSSTDAAADSADVGFAAFGDQ